LASLATNDDGNKNFKFTDETTNTPQVYTNFRQKYAQIFDKISEKVCFNQNTDKRCHWVVRWTGGWISVPYPAHTCDGITAVPDSITQKDACKAAFTNAKENVARLHNNKMTLEDFKKNPAWGKTKLAVLSGHGRSTAGGAKLTKELNDSTYLKDRHAEHGVWREYKVVKDHYVNGDGTVPLANQLEAKHLAKGGELLAENGNAGHRSFGGVEHSAFPSNGDVQRHVISIMNQAEKDIESHCAANPKLCQPYEDVKDSAKFENGNGETIQKNTERVQSIVSRMNHNGSGGLFEHKSIAAHRQLGSFRGTAKLDEKLEN